MLPIAILGALSAALLVLISVSFFDSVRNVSPQGCRMSWMSPSYVRQTDFNSSWTPLARRYSLWLYREVGWESNGELNGLPVLFLPGNAGSSHQIRSIASSAARQYYRSPYQVSPVFSSRNMKPLDFFSARFNEDFSAFHGPTLEAQKNYVTSAISYILSLYPPNTKIIIMAHSMGGIVATSLLPSPDISTIITVSTPHNLPPIRFDSRMESLFLYSLSQIANDTAPIVSLCGGITDEMIAAEFCAIPSSATGAYRKTVYTTALEGCWTGVGHNEMIWCHQVRWRIARAALELAGLTEEEERISILRDWFRDGLSVPASYHAGDLDLVNADYELHSAGQPLILRKPIGSKVYLLPFQPYLNTQNALEFVLYLSQGTIAPISPANPIPLTVSIFVCFSEGPVTQSLIPTCQRLEPDELNLIPNPPIGLPFPVPQEGVDESEGVVAFTAPLSTDALKNGKNAWIAVDMAEGDGRGWILGQFQAAMPQTNEDNILTAIYPGISISLNTSQVYHNIRIPKLISNVLFVYRVFPIFPQSCKEPLLTPMLLHTSNPSEAHYHRLNSDRPILLHGHSSAPFLPISPVLSHSLTRGINFTIYSSGECSPTELRLKLDFWNSIGRWGPRYWNAMIAWGGAIVGLIMFSSLSVWDSGAPMPTVAQALNSYAKKTLPKLTATVFILSFLPLPENFLLGNRGEPLLCMVAPMILLMSSGLVVMSYLLIRAAVWPFRKRVCKPCSGKDEPAPVRKPALISIMLISVLVSFLIPWQVAFIICYFLHFISCATDPKPLTLERNDTNNQKMHILLMMSWCLPVVIPVLAVWVRTLATAGLTTPFDGDHFVGNVLGFMMLTYATTSTRRNLLAKRPPYELVPIGRVYGLAAAIVFAVGGRATYRMYEALNWPTILLVIMRLGQSWWNGKI